MKNRHLLSIYDLSAKEIALILKKAFELKRIKSHNKIFNGKTLGLLFEKSSTRTMISFSVAMIQLGGNPLILNSQNLQLSRGETIHDTALVFSAYLDAVMIRAFNHSNVEEFAKYSSIPVINGLTDKEHPCQILGDIMTIMELFKINNINGLKDIKIVYCGDPNNICNSLIAMSSLLNLNFTAIYPRQYSPNKEILEKAHKTPARITMSNDIKSIENADVIYTDVWTSMGFEKEAQKRRSHFKPYQINSKLLERASNKVIILHCLPAKRGEEITDQVMNKYEYSIFTQAENRLHIQKSILLHLLH
jgi:ornithine carbamoyltransferase